MDYRSLTDRAIQNMLGARIKALRLRNNITQKELALATELSLNTIKSLEDGRGKLSSIIAVLRALGALDGIDNFIPLLSGPAQVSGAQAKRRERASGRRQRQGSATTTRREVD